MELKIDKKTTVPESKLMTYTRSDQTLTNKESITFSAYYDPIKKLLYEKYDILFDNFRYSVDDKDLDNFNDFIVTAWKQNLKEDEFFKKFLGFMKNNDKRN